ncbi:hypothetical protein Sgleb_32480 [Streptomyces glebosus]|uniref:Uncharacterized protein n=1 Tax=Streptomyces glebosus TaxID=249580 RepID=A0A640SY55_9ACTN|nr:hypothetical protein Sgleb_32480 [Streptomyces glebosus]GHG73047.1 hypothetical protein GCM10010513_46140 [Streptomyces glebosus]
MIQESYRFSLTHAGGDGRGPGAPPEAGVRPVRRVPRRAISARVAAAGTTAASRTVAGVGAPGPGPPRARRTAAGSVAFADAVEEVGGGALDALVDMAGAVEGG